jgi:excinuclease ABC subunit A
MLKSSARSAIRLRGVRHNNLKNFDLDVPLNQFVVITGLSGSGKSSLAFDTLFAEGQRRYIETFSPYARQFFDRMDKPQVDSIEGIPPAIAIEQRNAVKTTRSTVGTMTEICDYMKMLWPHVAQLHCLQCGRPVRKDSPQEIWQALQHGREEAGGKSEVRNPKSEILITFDLPLSEKLSLEESLALVAKQGYQRLLVGGQTLRLEEAASRITSACGSTRADALPTIPPLPFRRGEGRGEGSVVQRSGSSLTVVQDRLPLTEVNRARFVEACEQAYHFGKGKLAIHSLVSSGSNSKLNAHNPQVFSNRRHCAECDIEYREPSAALFSFNHPVGACPTCRGFGRVISIDYDLALPDRSRTLAQGVVRPWQTGLGAECQDDLLRICRKFRVPTEVPFNQLPKKWQDLVIEGEPGYGKDEAHEWPRAWYGVKGYFRWLESKAYKMHVRVLLSRYRAYTPCPDCRGKRFQPEALLYQCDRGNPKAEVRRPKEGRGAKSEGRTGLETAPSDSNASLTLADFYQLPIRDALPFIETLADRHRLRPNDPLGLVLNEVSSRLGYLNQVGLGYLTLDRPTRSLSGGETERVNLTTCLGTRLVNTLFVLDEPSVGLHPRDTERLVRLLEHLRNAGNTVVVVEHEASVIRAADQIVDLGPGHGATGGQVVFQGTYPQILKAKESLTGQYLSGRKQIEIPQRRAVKAGQGSRLSPPFRHRPSVSDLLALNDAPFPLGDGRDACPALTLAHATRHNLKDLSVEIPLGRFVCVTGVSGSGKTTLVREVLLPALEDRLKTESPSIKASDRLSPEGEGEAEDSDSPLATRHSPLLHGSEHLSRVVLVDQSILGKTPRSNPAVYIGAFDDIRAVFAQSEQAKQRGLNASAFSFNSSQGQCERCRGAGFEKIEMQFLSDIFIRCPDCNGRRYRSHILEIKLSPSSKVPASKSEVRSPKSEGRAQELDTAVARSTLHASRSTSSAPRPFSIADLLEATVEETVAFLSGFPDSRPAERAVESLKLLEEVGLGYLRLGQPINTLSGGESQRLKLVRHLAEVIVGADGGRPGAKSEIRSPKSEGSQSLPDVLPKSSAPLKVGRAVPSAPREDDEALTLRTSSDARGALGTARPTADLFGQHALPTSAPTLFLFDEPTTGLHFDDVRVLLKVFQRLVDAGHSVLVIEHNLEVMKSADWIIDLGPDAGDQGGQIVAAGTPEEIVACPESHTGRALRTVLPLPAVSAEPQSHYRE